MADEKRIKAKSEAKTTRTKFKGTLTRAISKLNRVFQERDKIKTLEQLSIVKQAFNDFEASNNKLYALIDDEQDLQECDKYFLEAEAVYTTSLEAVNVWLNPVSPSVTSSTSTDSQLLTAVNLPKLELSTYDGDPMLYYSFFTAFDELVDSSSASASSKLTRLRTYTSGAARRAIEPCLVLGGSQGYTLARKTLKERFGNDVLISQSLISSLGDSRRVSGATGLRALADDLVNCGTVLKRLGTDREVQSQRFIASVVDRLDTPLKLRYSKRAMLHMDTHGIYPEFPDLVQFVVSEAKRTSDPLFGEQGYISYNSDHANNNNKDNSKSASFISSGYQDNSSQLSCKFCNNNHRIYNCPGFKALTADQKYIFIIEKWMIYQSLTHWHHM